MSDVVIPPAKGDDGQLDTMKTTSVDQVASFLLSMAIMIGLAVLLLGALYYLSTLKPSFAPIVIEQENVAGRGDHAEGFERDLEPPPSEEVEQLNEPTVDKMLESITEAVSSIAANLDTMAASKDSGTGKGDSRPPGPEGEGDDIIPRYERWELRFSVRDQKSYAKQLDFFKIDLGAIGGGHANVDYARNFSTTVEKESGRPEQEQRLYFINRRDGPLLKYEKEILSKAGIPINGRLVLKLIPKELEEILVVIEKQYGIVKRGKNVSVKEFAKTIFECQPNTSGGYQWVVVEQRYRTPVGK
ncbi:MAG: hypothetical protein SGI77_05710 [Pirellulaceae bacterium]|nr:hypothetical protein [Pirellulaceae bacterium]